MITVLLADDHSIVRSGLKHIINSQSDMSVIDEAENGEVAVIKALDLKPDVVVMDLNMPKKSGLVATKQITEANQDIKIIILTMHENKEYLYRVLQAGASSYLLKSYNEDDLVDAIRTVHRGEAYLYPDATRLLLEDYMKRSNAAVEDNHAKLSGREQEILSYLAKGYTNKEIAEILYLSIKTIEAHKSKIMDKLDLKTRVDLVKFAMKNGYLDFE
ncbi:response regulator [Robertmurraya andreesenii]|uniref:Two-component system response regulator NreC n=1 Tax=Anoxybacillus andreesenii TaxID=1325932 RepID=A0ABT9V426_9BACL|nr:response regulator transcription factor [Robertmurraya andreesenii]MDQ0155703.1 two-component system response regulator NreC [Robertmurraya andreesenii]